MKKITILAALLFSFGCAFAQQPLYRYYNGKQHKHYFTRDYGEYGTGANGFVSEGVSCLIFTTADPNRGIVPVYRFYNAKTADHYFSTKPTLAPGTMTGYVYESPAFNVYNHQASGTTPLFEYLNPTTGDHFYTADKTELGPGFEGYVFDTVVGYVFRRQKQ